MMGQRAALHPHPLSLVFCFLSCFFSKSTGPPLWGATRLSAIIVLLTPKNTSVPNNEEHRTKGTEIA